MSKTKKELQENLIFCKRLLKEIEDEFNEKTKAKKDSEKNLYYNTSLIKRNKVLISHYLKELERY